MTPDQIHEQLDLSDIARDAFLQAHSLPDAMHVFKALLSHSDHSLLNQLAYDLNTSPSRLIRGAIRAMFLMHFEHVPTCALGKPCSEPTATRPTLQPEKDPSS